MAGKAGTSWIDLGDLFGEKPDVPELPRLTLAEEQRKAIEANLAAAPKAAELARLSQEQIRSMMNFAMPGYDTLAGQATSNISDALKGILSPDVAAMTRIGTAGQALAGGFASGRAGSMGRNLEARQLGLTSLAQQRWGQSALQGWLGAMEQLYAPSQALYSSSFITPMQQYTTERQEENLQWERQYLVNQIAAMPDPAARGIYDTVMNLVNSYLGGSYAGQYQPNYGGATGGVNFGGQGGGAGGALWGSSGAYAPTGAGGGAGFGGTFDSSIGGAAAGAFF